MPTKSQSYAQALTPAERAEHRKVVEMMQPVEKTTVGASVVPCVRTLSD